MFLYSRRPPAAVTPQHIVYRLYQTLYLLISGSKKARNGENEVIIVFHVIYKCLEFDLIE